MVNKEKRLINKMKKGTPELKTPIASEMFLPNQSGDHSAGSVRTTPIADTDIANKKYIDDKNVESFPTTLTSGSIPFSNGSSLAQDNSNLFWDAVNFILNSKNINLPDTTTSNTGVIYKGVNRFIHNFHHPTGGGAVPRGLNTFIGVNAGNFTMGSTATSDTDASKNVGIGDDALGALTIGRQNMAIGQNTLGTLTTGTNNIGMGVNNLTSMTSGENNVAVGTFSLVSANANDNVGIGYATLANITSGLKNIGIGKDAGRYRGAGTDPNQTTNDSIYIGYQARASADGVDNEIVIGLRAIGKGANTAQIGGPTTTDVYISQKIKLTVSGGYAIKLTNKTGNNSVAGELVNAHTSVENAVEATAINDTIPIGAFLDSGVSDGSEAWIVVGGIAQVKVDASTTVAVGDWVKVSSNTAGRCESSGTEQPGANHFREVGHALEGGGNNELIKIAMHFN